VRNKDKKKEKGQELMDVKDNPSPVSVTTTPLMVPIEKEG